jgi:hypothetical protein
MWLEWQSACFAVQSPEFKPQSHQKKKEYILNQVFYCMPEVPAFRRLRYKDRKFKASLRTYLCTRDKANNSGYLFISLFAHVSLTSKNNLEKLT